jgi:hypothetical protein
MGCLVNFVGVRGFFMQGISARRDWAAPAFPGAAIPRMESRHGVADDWVVGGNFNAALATDDCRELLAGAVMPVGAADSAGRAVCYLKRPQSPLDRVLLSQNLRQTYGDDEWCDVVADRPVPSSCHDLGGSCPLFVRLSILNRPPTVRPPERQQAAASDPTFAELRKVLRGDRPAPPVQVRSVGKARIEGGRIGRPRR